MTSSRQVSGRGHGYGSTRLVHVPIAELMDEHFELFAALKSQGDFVDAVIELEQTHTRSDSQLASLDVAESDFDRRVKRLLDNLSEQIDKENLGTFPVAVVTRGAAGWEVVTAAHS